MKKKVSGIIVPNLVPLKSGGSINESELRRMVDFLIDGGVTGIYPNGSTGEFTRFTYEERVEITRIIAEQSCGRLTIIAGAAEANTEVILETCAKYESFGCHAAVLCGPYYYKLSQESVYQHFAEVAERTPIDLMLYNIPQFSNEISMDVVKRLAFNYERIIGIKDSSGNLVRLCHLMNEIWSERPEFCILTGTEEILLPSLVAGVDGGTIATAGVLPEVVMALHRSALNGDYEKAREIQFGLLRLIKTMHSISFPHGWRAAARFRGLNVGQSRQRLSASEKMDSASLESQICHLLAEHVPGISCPIAGRDRVDEQAVERIVTQVLRRLR